jgi:hypothetical protein
VINFNFQEGSGTTLKNTALGCDVTQFNSKEFDGSLKSNVYTNPLSSFQWVSGGRWGKYKKALQFNGVDTYVEMPGTYALNFKPTDSFTLIAWVRFDRFQLGDPLYSKSWWSFTQPVNKTEAQYDLYYDGTSYGTGKGSGEFEVDIFQECFGWDKSDIDLSTSGWVQVALRFSGADNLNATTYQNKTDVFVNGKKLANVRKTNNATALYDSSRSKCVLGGVPTDPAAWGSTMRFVFQGRMDEFLMYKRALADGEIKGNYDMGKEF